MTDQPVSWLVIERGWTVVAADGAEVGKIDSVVGDENADIFDGLSVSTSTLTRPLYVPAEAVGTIMPGQVALELDAAAIEQLEPYEPPATAGAIMPESSSFWERMTGWFRRPR
jgi:hypothetical protein